MGKIAENGPWGRTWRDFAMREAIQQVGESCCKDESHGSNNSEEYGSTLKKRYDKIHVRILVSSSNLGSELLYPESVSSSCPRVVWWPDNRYQISRQQQHLFSSSRIHMPLWSSGISEPRGLCGSQLQFSSPPAHDFALPNNMATISITWF